MAKNRPLEMCWCEYLGGVSAGNPKGLLVFGSACACVTMVSIL